MQLQCPALLEGNEMPRKYTCDGDNISPPLTWQDPPNGTRTFALIVEDPDAPDTVFTHWLVYDMPVERQELPEGVDGHPELPSGGKQGQNDFGETGFGGPCPPQGMHRYVFRLFALDQTLEMAPGSNKGDLLQLMQGHILETAEITSTYTRQGGKRQRPHPHQGASCAPADLDKECKRQSRAERFEPPDKVLKPGFYPFRQK